MNATSHNKAWWASPSVRSWHDCCRYALRADVLPVRAARIWNEQPWGRGALVRYRVAKNTMTHTGHNFLTKSPTGRRPLAATSFLSCSIGGIDSNLHKPVNYDSKRVSLQR